VTEIFVLRHVEYGNEQVWSFTDAGARSALLRGVDKRTDYGLRPGAASTIRQHQSRLAVAIGHVRGILAAASRADSLDAPSRTQRRSPGPGRCMVRLFQDLH
jgi:hypothetical protein